MDVQIPDHSVYLQVYLLVHGLASPQIVHHSAEDKTVVAEMTEQLRTKNPEGMPADNLNQDML